MKRKEYASDVLYGTYFIIAAARCMCTTSVLSVTEWNILLMQALIYLTFRFLFHSSLAEKIETACVLALAVLTFRQCLIGLRQAFGAGLSGHVLFCCTGSFGNPGPYGGFLAVSAAILITWCSIHRKWHHKAGRILQIAAGTAASFCLVLLPATQSRAGITALLCGIFLWHTGDRAMRRKHRMQFHKYRFRTSAVIVAGVILLAAGSVFAYRFKKDSAYSRILMSRISWIAIGQHPLFGSGAGGFMRAYGDALYSHFSSGDFTEQERLAADCAEYPFNTFLCAGVEYGLPAMAVLLMATLLGIVRSIRSRSCLGYGMAALSAFAVFSYPQELPVFQFMLPVLAASGSDGKHRYDTEGAVIAFALSLVSAAAIFSNQMHGASVRKAESQWRSAAAVYRSGHYERAAELYAPLVPSLRYSPGFMFEYGHSLLRTGQYSKADSILAEGSELSYDPMFLNLRGQCMQEMGDTAAAAGYYRRAFLTIPNRLYPLYLLARMRFEYGDTAGFLDTAQRIRHFVPKIESGETLRMRAETDSLRALSEIETD